MKGHQIQWHLLVLTFIYLPFKSVSAYLMDRLAWYRKQLDADIHCLTGKEFWSKKDKHVIVDMQTAFLFASFLTAVDKNTVFDNKTSTLWSVHG